MVWFNSLLSLAFVLTSVARCEASPALTERAAPSSFSLYAYSTKAKIGGMTLWSANNQLYVGRPLAGATTASLTFSLSNSQVTVIASNVSATIGENLYYDTTTTTNIGLTTSPAAGQVTNTLAFFQAYLVIKDPKNGFESSYYADSVADGTWAIKWVPNGSSVSKDLIPLVINTVAPGKLATND